MKTKQERLVLAKKEHEKFLKSVGYTGKKKLKIPFPDLKVESIHKLSNNIEGVGKRKILPEDVKQFPVGHLHKQGFQLITPNALKEDIAYFGGKKP